jgi:hypothetical protein
LRHCVCLDTRPSWTGKRTSREKVEVNSLKSLKTAKSHISRP